MTRSPLLPPPPIPMLILRRSDEGDWLPVLPPPPPPSSPQRGQTIKPRRIVQAKCSEQVGQRISCFGGGRPEPPPFLVPLCTLCGGLLNIILLTFAVGRGVQSITRGGSIERWAAAPVADGAKAAGVVLDVLFAVPLRMGDGDRSLMVSRRYQSSKAADGDLRAYQSGPLPPPPPPPPAMAFSFASSAAFDF